MFSGIRKCNRNCGQSLPPFSLRVKQMQLAEERRWRTACVLIGKTASESLRERRTALLYLLPVKQMGTHCCRLATQGGGKHCSHTFVCLGLTINFVNSTPARSLLLFHYSVFAFGLWYTDRPQSSVLSGWAAPRCLCHCQRAGSSGCSLCALRPVCFRRSTANRSDQQWQKLIK